MGRVAEQADTSQQASTSEAAPAFHKDTTPLPADVTHSSRATGRPRPASRPASGAIARTIVGLAIVLAVVYGLYWLLKKRHRGAHAAQSRRPDRGGRDDHARPATARCTWCAPATS